MLDYAQSFEEFSSSLKPLDLALYAGIGLVLWVLFKDRLSPVQVLLGSAVDKLKNLFNQKVPTTNNSNVSYNTSSLFDKVNSVVAPEAKPVPAKEDLFFKLIVSWKETRDLAVSCGCEKAVEVADTMFPYLSPSVCAEENKDA